ncbi:MAG: DNA repair protein RadC [Comamonas sp.]
MSQLSFSSFDASLMVRDAQGRYVLATADQILDAARQAIEHKMQRGASLTSPEVVKEYLCPKLGGAESEVFAVLFLDTQHRLIEYAEMFHGTIDSTSVYPREVVKAAIRHNAAAVVVSHNHPSGNPEPSGADRALTQRLKDALALVDVRVLDHVIVAGSCTVSFAQCGLI